MALNDVAPVLAKDFVILKIDRDRMVGGKDLLARYRELKAAARGEAQALASARSGVLPWFAFLDGNGKVLVTSDDPDTGNIGYPGNESGSHFRRMFQTVVKRITPAEIDALIESVKAFRTTKLTT